MSCSPRQMFVQVFCRVESGETAARNNYFGLFHGMSRVIATLLSVLEFVLRLMGVAVLQSLRGRGQRLDEQLRQSRVIRVTGGASAIWQNPLRVLRAERIVHLALQRDIRWNFRHHYGKRSRAHH